jgi:hypothetical protein
MTETDHQILVMCWAKKIALAGRPELGFLYHTPNGGSRGKREAGILKAMGVKAGVSDLFLPIMASGKGGLWIEMKADKGRESEEQLKWIYDMQHNGYEAKVCWSWRDAIEAICDYLGGEWPDVDMDSMESRLCR